MLPQQSQVRLRAGELLQRDVLLSIYAFTTIAVILDVEPGQVVPLFEYGFEQVPARAGRKEPG